MKITLFGATGPTGLQITLLGLAAGHELTAVARTPAKLDLQHPRLKIVQGDALRPESVGRAIEGADAVVSSLGVAYGFASVTLYSAGATNILAAMKSAGVRRFVGITSGGTYLGHDPKNPFFFERVLKRLYQNLYDDMRKMERIVMGSDVEWTILRPSRLLNTPATGKVREMPNEYSLANGGTLSRSDLALAVLRYLEPGAPVRTAVAIAH